MNGSVPPMAVVLAGTVAAIGLSLAYFRRYAVPRPPIGVFNTCDVAVMLVVIVLVPYVYMALPAGGVTAFLTLLMLSILSATLEPVVRSRWLRWALVLLLVGGDIAACRYLGGSVLCFAVNDLVLVLSVIGIANLWAQGGMRAAHAAFLGAALTVYDFIATARLPLTGDLIRKLSAAPFAPMFAWPTGANGQWLGIGLGDLLMASVFPLVMGKAFGGRAAVWAAILNVAAIGGLLVLLVSGRLSGGFPVMVVLGPLMVAQYVFRRVRFGPERTFRQYDLARRPGRSFQGTARTPVPVPPRSFTPSGPSW